MKLVSKQCLDFIKSFEGFYSTPYKDLAGVKTLGYGMTGREIQGLNYVTEPQARQMLENILNNNYAAPIKANLDSKGITLNQNQFDALVSFAYNIGVNGLMNSALYKNICAGVRDPCTITANFTAWSKVGGQVVPGLLRRRQAEATMFFGSGNQQPDVLIENVKDPIRIALIKALQYNLNLDYNAKLANADGNIYQSTLDALESVGELIVKGHKSHLVLWVQQRLVKWDYLKKGAYTDMIYDEPTFQAVTNLQKAWNRETSGKILVSNNTWQIFLNN
jgi:GH24 family phage-related lysozyme (muramidase)